MIRAFIIALAYMHVTGCAAIGDPAPYFDVGVGYQINKQSDWYRQTTRDWECSENYRAEFEAGLDWGSTTLGYHHQSWYLCGKPFNSKNETWADDIRLTHRFGGKK